MDEDGARLLEHAWRYFSLHSEQRMTVFNFYVATAGLALTGLAWTLADGSQRWPLGSAAGVGAAMLSFVFWRLDQRGAQLIKIAEDAIATLEGRLPASAAPMLAERRLSKNAGWTKLAEPWTFGRSFRMLFSTVALLGIVGAGLTMIVGVTRADERPSSPAEAARLKSKRPQNRATCASTLSPSRFFEQRHEAVSSTTTGVAPLPSAKAHSRSRSEPAVVDGRPQPAQ